MAVIYEERPELFRGTGTVFIARDDGLVWGYWDALPDRRSAPLEPLPEGLTLRVAAVWGLERTPRVLARTGSSGYVAVGPQAFRFENDDDVDGVVTLETINLL